MSDEFGREIEAPTGTDDTVPRSLKVGALITFVGAMAVLLIGGLFNRNKVPPYPERVIADAGAVVCDKDAIMRGQHVYQRYGLMDHGSVCRTSGCSKPCSTRKRSALSR